METTRANSITAAQNMHSKRRPVRGAISNAKIWWKKTVCLQMWVRMWRQVKMRRQNTAAPKCGFRHKCGGASEMMEMWLQTMWRRNVASSTNLVAPPKMTEMWRQTMWRQAQMWWQSEMWRQTMRRQNVASGTNVVAVRNVASNNVASKCGVRHSLCQTVFQEMCLQKRYSVAGTKVLH